MSVQTGETCNPVAEQAIATVGEIATLPEVTVRIIEVVEDPEGTAKELHEIIKRDMALSTRVLKVVNSAFYGLPGQIANLDRAIVLLGLSAVKNIAIAASMARMFRGRQDPDLFDAKELWKHSVAVAVAAKNIDQIAGNIVGSDKMFLAGLIHDVGLVVERQAHPRELADVVRRCRAGEKTFSELEAEIVGATHQEFGLALTTKWKFPEHLRCAVGFHHNPDDLPENIRRVGMVLRCADILCCQEDLGFDLLTYGDEFTQELLDAVEITVDQLVEIRDTLGPELDEAETVLGAR
jgi:HD-like signal output (HDOD) protein